MLKTAEGAEEVAERPGSGTLESPGPIWPWGCASAVLPVLYDCRDRCGSEDSRVTEQVLVVSGNWYCPADRPGFSDLLTTPALHGNPWFCGFPPGCS